MRQRIQQRPDQIQWQRKHDGRGLAVARHVGQRLQIAQLQRLRLLRQQRCSVAQFLGGLQLTVGVDHLGAAFALGFGLTRNRAHHRLVEVYVLDLDVRDLDPPRIGGFVENRLQRAVDRLAL